MPHLAPGGEDSRMSDSEGLEDRAADPFEPAGRRARMEALESYLSAVAMLFTGLMVTPLLLWAATGLIQPEGSPWLAAAGIGACAGLIFLEGWMIAGVLRHWGKHPFVLHLARSLPGLPRALRPLAALVWFMHGLVGALMAAAIEVRLPHHDFASLMIGLINSFLLVDLTFGYVLLSAASLAATDRLLMRLWRARFRFALFLAVTAQVVGRLAVLASE